MNEHDRFLKFRGAHRRMQVAQHIDTLTTSNGHSNGKKMQGTEHLPNQLPWRYRTRERIKRVLAVVVKKDEQGKYSVSQPLALSVLGFILIFGATWYWRSSDKIAEQHDEIIRLQTRLDLEKEKNIDQDSKIDQARATAQIADKNAARLEGKFDQFALQYATKKRPQGEE